MRLYNNLLDKYLYYLCRGYGEGESLAGCGSNSVTFGYVRILWNTIAKLGYSAGLNVFFYLLKDMTQQPNTAINWNDEL